MPCAVAATAMMQTTLTVCGWKPGHAATVWLVIHGPHGDAGVVTKRLPTTAAPPPHRVAMGAISVTEEPQCYVSKQQAVPSRSHYHTPHGFVFATHYKKYKETTSKGCERCGKPMVDKVVRSSSGKEFCSLDCAEAWAAG